MSDLTSRNRQYDSHTKNVSISGGARVAVSCNSSNVHCEVSSIPIQSSAKVL